MGPHGLFLGSARGLQGLVVRAIAEPEPSAGQVRVQVQAAGLNFAELMASKGLYPDAPKPPCIVGYEGAGVIDAVGAGVAASRVGERVLFLKKFGAHASAVVVAQEAALPLPEAMSFVEAAALPVNYLTAYHMLFAVARVQPGEHVLVHMAAGGVGTAVLQLCRSVPGVVTYGTCSREKHEYARQHGCHHAIDYRAVDYAKEVRRLTGGRGVDLVLDPLGAADTTKGYDLLAPCGKLIAFGLANAHSRHGGKWRAVAKALIRVPRFSPMRLMNDNKGVLGVNLGHLFGEPARMHRQLEAILERYRAGQLAPHVGATFPLSQARQGFELLEAGRNVGKVVLTIERLEPQP